MAWNVDRRKMYAHVYFDLSADTLGIAVYSIGKIPGFSGTLNEELENATQTSRAYDLFLKTLGKDTFTKEELQLGKRFDLQDVEDKLKKLDILGKLHAEKPEAQVVVDLDDPITWFNSRLSSLSKEQQVAAQGLLEEKKREIGQQARAQEMEQEMAQAKTPEDQEKILQKVYTVLSRGLNPKHGPKDFPGTKKYPTTSPPTFLVSKQFNVAYYPGFKGAQYMTKTPKSLEYVHPQQEENKEKWHQVLITDTKQYMDGKSLSSFKIEPLDYASEILARLFFYSLSEAGEKSLTFMDFNKAISPVTSKAKSLLQQIGGEKKDKVASQRVGAWIDLYDGRIYASQAEVVAAKTNKSQQEERSLAAEQKVNRLAEYFLKKKNYMIYARLKKELRTND